MIRWINNWLGTAPYDAIAASDAVVIDVRHHVDKAGNPADALRLSIEAGRTAYKSGKKIVVACDFGVSRSNAIAAAILSRALGQSFEQSLAQVMAATGEKNIKLEMITSVRAALDEAPPAKRRDAVLITGGAGYIGRHLFDALSPSPSVLAPGRSELDLLEGETRLAQYCERHAVGQIVHLAYPRHYTNPEALGQSIGMLQGVLSVGKTLGLRLILVSGWVVFSGYTEHELLADETLPRRARGHYGDAKLLEETLSEEYRLRGEMRGALCRFAPIYGPASERPRLIRTFTESIVAGRPIVTHKYMNGRPALDLLHVSDAVEALKSVIYTDVAGTFHFGTARLTETAQIAALLASLLKKPLKHEEMQIDDHVANVAMNWKKAASELGWQPKIPLEDGLADLLAPDARSSLRHQTERAGSISP